MRIGWPKNGALPFREIREFGETLSRGQQAAIATAVEQISAVAESYPAGSEQRHLLNMIVAALSSRYVEFMGATLPPDILGTTSWSQRFQVALIRLDFTQIAQSTSPFVTLASVLTHEGDHALNYIEGIYPGNIVQRIQRFEFQAYDAELVYLTGGPHGQNISRSTWGVFTNHGASLSRQFSCQGMAAPGCINAGG